MIRGYALLLETLQGLTAPVLPFDARAIAIFDELRGQKVRVSTMDLRIASIAISRNNAKTLPDSKILSALASVLGITLDDLLRSQGEGLPNFRFRAHVTFAKNAQFAAQVLRMLQTYNALEQAVGDPPYTPESTPCHQVEGNEKRIQAIDALFRHRLGLGDAPIANLFQSRYFQNS